MSVTVVNARPAWRFDWEWWDAWCRQFTDTPPELEKMAEFYVDLTGDMSRRRGRGMVNSPFMPAPSDACVDWDDENLIDYDCSGRCWTPLERARAAQQGARWGTWQRRNKEWFAQTGRYLIRGAFEIQVQGFPWHNFPRGAGRRWSWNLTRTYLDDRWNSVAQGDATTRSRALRDALRALARAKQAPR